ncbi:hypothetical protein F5884DRAFT_809617, partial [Xylogone sp. PMI_703]
MKNTLFTSIICLNFAMLYFSISSALGFFPFGALGSAHSRPTMLNVSKHIPKLNLSTVTMIFHASSQVSTYLPKHRLSYVKRITSCCCSPRSTIS